MGGWNYGLLKFFTNLPIVGLVESAIILFALQILSIFLVRPLRQEIIPIYVPLEAKHFPKEEE